MTSQHQQQQEHNPFGGVQGPAEIERLEAGGHDANRTSMVGFEGQIHTGPDGTVDLRLTDPKQTVEAYVRPGRSYSVGIPEGTRVRVDYATYQANRGVLCTAQELAKIRHTQGAADQQAMTRDLQAMRRDSITSSRMGMDPEKLAAEREKAARELGEVVEQQAADMARAHAEMVKPPPAKPMPETREALEQRIEEMRAGAEALAGRLGAKGAGELQRVLEAEITELRQAFALQEQVAQARVEQIQERRSAAAPPEGKATRRERLVELKALHADGLITEDQFKERQAHILAEV